MFCSLREMFRGRRVIAPGKSENAMEPRRINENTACLRNQAENFLCPRNITHIRACLCLGEEIFRRRGQAGQTYHENPCAVTDATQYRVSHRLAKT